MYTLIQFMILLGVSWNVGLFFQSLVALHLLKKQKRHKTGASDSKIHILIAIRNEDVAHVRECIEYFLSQSKIARLSICLTEIGQDHKKYLPLINELQQKDNRLLYSTFTGERGYKAEQINIALAQILESHEDVLIGIYDIDSKPDQRIFEFLEINKVDVGQQFTLYDANTNDLQPLVLAGALHQTSWAISFEMFNFFFPRRRLVYTVGHGLFLSSDTLRKCGLFDEDCMTEDLMYGYKASVGKRVFHVIPYYEHAKFVKSVRAFISQSSRWYAGELEITRRFPIWFQKFGGDFRDKIHLHLRLAELFWWPLERIIYASAVMGAIAGLLSTTVALLYTGVLIVSGSVSAIVITKNSGWNARFFLAILLVPVWHVISAIGPVAALINKLFGLTIKWTVTEK